MPHYHESDAPHWYVHIDMDVIDANAARTYLQEQTLIEESNKMHSFEIFVDNPENPKEAVLVECFRDDKSQKSHLENIRLDKFASVFTNFRVRVYGNPPKSVIDRMLSAGFWPPAFTGEFRHMPYFIGYRS
ncbi:MAG: hypothetical protein MK209_09870 [Planctomycetes bacterium]|nr:hypothetical protein [Planctomycetota bacterium]